MWFTVLTHSLTRLYRLHQPYVCIPHARSHCRYVCCLSVVVVNLVLTFVGGPALLQHACQATRYYSIVSGQSQPALWFPVLHPEASDNSVYRVNAVGPVNVGWPPYKVDFPATRQHCYPAPTVCHTVSAVCHCRYVCMPYSEFSVSAFWLWRHQNSSAFITCACWC